MAEQLYFSLNNSLCHEQLTTVACGPKSSLRSRHSARDKQETIDVTYSFG